MNWRSNRSPPNRVPSTYQALIHWLGLAYQVVRVFISAYCQHLVYSYCYRRWMSTPSRLGLETRLRDMLLY